MSDILKYGQGILFMKVGTHADEPLEEIIARKIREIDSAGYAMWGYGGNTCHPTSIVQPFARDYTIGKNNIYLCMQSMESKHFAAPKRAEKYSIDGVKWEDIPKGVNVLGSRYALVIKNLEDITKNPLKLDLKTTEVAEGPSMGKTGKKYIQGRVDKACLKIKEHSCESGDTENTEDIIKISLIANIVKPYAVFVK
jgi:hypothetical protein